MYFGMVKYEMFFISAVKTLTCSNRWQLDSRCCWCGSGLNRTRKGDRVNNELPDRSFWKKNTQISGYLPVFRHTDATPTANIYAAAVANVAKLACWICFVLFSCMIVPFSIPVSQLWGRSCCTSTAWTVSSGMPRQYSGCTRLSDRR